MKVVSVNIGKKRTVSWRGKDILTGIYKYPVKDSIFLGETDVINDDVVDRRYHGGRDKACYLYSSDHYSFWKENYPDLEWTYGMFGENITIKGLDETKVLIGDIYRVGGSTVQVSQPRQPCFKLGIRFNDSGIIKKFINSPYPGVYIRIIDGTKVNVGDSFDLIERQHNSVGLLEVWTQLYTSNPNIDLINEMLILPYLADASKNSLRKRIAH